MKKNLLICSILLTMAFIVNAQTIPYGASVANANACTMFALPIQKGNVTCYGGNNGNVIVYSLNGTRPYSYSWIPTVINLPLDTINIAIAMAAGTYTCLITDAAGCTYKMKVTITQPPKLTLTTVSSASVTCYGGNNGSASVVAGGGTPVYAYAWNPAVSTTTSASNLKAGTYIVTVTDTSNCNTKDTIKILQPPAIAAAITTVPSACNSGNGSVSITASNGITPYSYYWAPGGQTTSSITNLTIGSYVCTITDANGCTAHAAATVKDSTTLNSTLLNSANVKCYGNNDGLAAFNVTGGLGHDTYLWMPAGGTNTSAFGLSAGTYTFTATDSVGCKTITTVTITEPKQLRDSMTNVRNIACHGGFTGRATATMLGGTSPFTYLWSTGATTANINGVPAGIYTVSITDKNGCTDTGTITLTQPATALADSSSMTSIACHGGTSNAAVYPYGGTGAYTYAWAPGGNTTSAAVVTANTYIVSIRDANNCLLRDTLAITQPASFIVAKDTSLSFPCSSKAWVQVTGTLSDYTFSWAPSGGTKDTASNLCIGNYTVTISNSAGCIEKVSFKIVDPSSGIHQYTYNNDIQLFPVPAKNQINISIMGSFAPSSLSVFDITGRELMTEKMTSNTNSHAIDISQLSGGTYFLKLTDNKSGLRFVKFVVSEK